MGILALVIIPILSFLTAYSIAYTGNMAVSIASLALMFCGFAVYYLDIQQHRLKRTPE